MGIQLTALMMKTSGNPANLRPEMETFPLARTHDTAIAMLNDIAERFPSAMNTRKTGNDVARDEQGAILLKDDALTVLNAWGKMIRERLFFTDCPSACSQVAQMLDLAQKGFSLVLIED